ncbi:MAG: hypothetical protein KZQ99_22865, partial [Candidatus Thiodiazotropha sp. (ex Dulcina madagascariensis)]|nr:hypothetical protein [Candidatus Thiodiazotropha sp. (ex Dulcina madagascariensis)]
ESRSSRTLEPSRYDRVRKMRVKTRCAQTLRPADRFRLRFSLAPERDSEEVVSLACLRRFCMPDRVVYFH